jgi:cell division protein FtsI/penicillin-binding protein 2
LLAGFLLGFSVPCVSQVAPPDLFGQATATMLNRMLDRSFPSKRIEYLLLDVRTRRTIAEHWPDARTPIPVGSLLKPFVAMAFAGSHAGRFPVVHCSGKSDRCWKTGGHGSLGLERALAESCNAYFLALAREVPASEMNRVSAAYGLPAPPGLGASSGGEGWAGMLIGVTPEWRVAPGDLAEAYARLATQAKDRDASLERVLTGMKMAAKAGGTASKVGSESKPGGVLAKTGTAPCVHDCVATGDGLVVALAPAEEPRMLLLVRERGTTGAETAIVAGQMLASLRDARADDR